MLAILLVHCDKVIKCLAVLQSFSLAVIQFVYIPILNSPLHPFPPSFFIVFLPVADEDVVVVFWDETCHIGNYFGS